MLDEPLVVVVLEPLVVMLLEPLVVELLELLELLVELVLELAPGSVELLAGAVLEPPEPPVNVGFEQAPAVAAARTRRASRPYVLPLRISAQNAPLMAIPPPPGTPNGARTARTGAEAFADDAVAIPTTPMIIPVAPAAARPMNTLRCRSRVVSSWVTVVCLLWLHGPLLGHRALIEPCISSALAPNPAPTPNSTSPTPPEIQAHEGTFPVAGGERAGASTGGGGGSGLAGFAEGSAGGGGADAVFGDFSVTSTRRFFSPCRMTIDRSTGSPTASSKRTL